MAKCPVCESEYSENQVNFCITCGWDLTPYPKSLGMIPEAFLEKERTKINWARKTWKKHQDKLSESSLKLEQANHNISELKTQLEQAQQINKMEYQSQLDHIHSQLQIATEERTQIQLELNQVNQKLSQIQLFHQESIQTTSPIKTEEDVELKSAVGMDYTNLKNYLERENWPEADEETRRVMLVVAKRGYEGYLDKDSINTFPCEDLRTIDELWVKYSDGKFGFSVQKRIFLFSGGIENHNQMITWNIFGSNVGWSKQQNYSYSSSLWLNYKDITFDKTAPEGHLPLRVFSDPRVSGRNWLESSHATLFPLISRLAKCNI